MKKIIVRKVEERKYTITADGRTRRGFISKQDAAEWIGTMQAHGLFPEYKAYLESETGMLSPMETTYENPCVCPAIAR